MDPGFQKKGAGGGGRVVVVLLMNNITSGVKGGGVLSTFGRLNERGGGPPRKTAC